MDAAQEGVARRFARVWYAPLRQPWTELAAVLIGVPMLLSVAIWNGFPIIYYDTGAYVMQGLGHVFIAERSPVYSLFLEYAGGRSSLWYVAILQALAISFIIVQVARVEARSLSLGVFLAIVSVLVIVTALPWYAGQIEPDCFTAVTVLCTYLLALHTGGMGRGRSIAVFAIGSFAAATHPTHLALIVGLVIVVGVIKLVSIVWHGREALQKSNIVLPLLSAVLGLALIVAGNYTLTGKIFINRTGSVFVLASFLQGGLVTRLLDDTCPGSGYALCAYRNLLPETADQYLWVPNTPFDQLGRFEGTAAESERVVADIIARYPGAVALWSLRDMAVQLVTFRTGDQIEPQEWAIYNDLNGYIPKQMDTYIHARQQQGQIHFTILSALHVFLAAAAQLAMLGGILLALRRQHWGAAVFLGFIAAALFGNALICGALSNPHDRYQSRLVWMPVLALALLGTEGRFSLRQPAESGT